MEIGVVNTLIIRVYTSFKMLTGGAVAQLVESRPIPASLSLGSVV